MASFSSHVPLKFSIQSPSARFPYRIRMVCGPSRNRMLNLQTIGRYFDDSLNHQRRFRRLRQMRSRQADRPEYQARLNERHRLAG